MKELILIKLKDEVTHEEFGCEPAFFDSYIKDQALLALFEYEQCTIVRDPSCSLGFFSVKHNWIASRKVVPTLKKLTCLFTTPFYGYDKRMNFNS